MEHPCHQPPLRGHLELVLQPPPLGHVFRVWRCDATSGVSSLLLSPRPKRRVGSLKTLQPTRPREKAIRRKKQTRQKNKLFNHPSGTGERCFGWTMFAEKHQGSGYEHDKHPGFCPKPTIAKPPTNKKDFWQNVPMCHLLWFCKGKGKHPSFWGLHVIVQPQVTEVQLRK